MIDYLHEATGAPRKSVVTFVKALTALIGADLESLLAAVQSSPNTRILVFYEAAHQSVLDKVHARLRIDAAFTLPVQEAQLRATLLAWLENRPVDLPDVSKDT